MATYNGRVEGVLVRGMHANDIRTNATIGQKVIAGSLDTLTPGSRTVTIGARLAEALGVKLGSDISLVSPQGQATPFGTVPRIVKYTVGAVFEIGIYDYDKTYVVMPMEDAQTLLLMGDSVGMIEVNTVDANRIGQILLPLAGKIGGEAGIADWRPLRSEERRGGEGWFSKCRSRWAPYK